MKYSRIAAEFEETKAIPLFEIAMINGDYLLVNLSVKYKKGKAGSVYPVGLCFDFDQCSPEYPYNQLPVFFDGCVTGKHGYYSYPFDECFSLDEHLQEIYSNVIEGFLIPNKLLAEEV